MAATYTSSQPTAKDRVRRMIADVAVPFRFQDEEIAFELTNAGFEGDPLGPTSQQLIAELTAAVTLLESQPGSAGYETTIKQGSVSRTVKAGDFSGVLASLRNRLNLALAAQYGGGTGIAVVQPDYPETRRDQGWSGFGLPTQ